jgi:transcriptional regulator MraZ
VEPNESAPINPPVEMPRGRFPGRLDDKARLKLPTAFAHFFNSLPERKLFLTSLDRHTASLYPVAEWRVNEKFFDSYHADPDAAATILFNAQDLGGDVEMDSQNRITVHPDLRRDLGLEGTELHLIAVKGHVEILTDAQYQEMRRKSTETTPDALRAMKMAGLR